MVFSSPPAKAQTQFTSSAPRERVVTVAFREADIYELFALPRREGSDFDSCLSAPWCEADSDRHRDREPATVVVTEQVPLIYSSGFSRARTDTCDGFERLKLQLG